MLFLFGLPQLDLYQCAASLSVLSHGKPEKHSNDSTQRACGYIFLFIFFLMVQSDFHFGRNP